MYIAVSGAVAQERRIEVIANNLANINTPGYKKDYSVFQSVLAEHQLSSLSTTSGSLFSQNNNNTGFFENAFVDLVSIRTDFSPGVMEVTGNKTDCSIEGEGFFVVQTSEGTRYTRNGCFTVNSKGELGFGEGRVVLGKSGVSIVPDGAQFDITQNGDVVIDDAVVDTLKVVTFEDRDDLIKVGNAEFALRNPDIREKEAENYSLHQGFVERSNVEPIQEMVEMITVHRAYQAYEKAIRTSDDMTGRLISQAMA